MPADRLLGTLLRALHNERAPQELSRLLPITFDGLRPLTNDRLTSTAASLLTALHNPLNLSLLTSQLLSAPAIWTRPDGLRTCLRVFGTFHSASIASLEPDGSQQPSSSAAVLGQDEWVKAIVHGADEKSPRWRHPLVIGGLLLGFEGQHKGALPSALRRDLETALVTALNLALQNTRTPVGLDGQCLALVMNYCFPLLSDVHRLEIDYDVRSVLRGKRGC